MKSTLLDCLVEIKGGGTPRRDLPEYWGGSIPWATVKDFVTTVLDSTQESITKLGVSKSATNIIPAGNIIVPTRMALGKAAINLVDVAINQDLKALIPIDLRIIDRDYLFRFLLSKAHYIESRGKGATVKGIRLDVLKELEVPLPPIEEQKRIAAILDKADAIRRKRRQAIQLADEFLRSVFLDMFGDLTINDKKWPICTINELLANKPNAIRTGPFGSQLKHSEFIKTGIPVLGIDNIVTNEFRWTVSRCLPAERYRDFKRYRVFPEDVIVTIMGTTGRVAVTPSELPECMSTKHLCVLTLNKEIIDPAFLWATLLYDRIVRDQAKISGGGAIMEGWNMTIIKNLKINVPPKGLQEKFRSIYNRKIKLKKLLREGSKEANIFFSSLSQRAFRGEL